MWASRTVDIKTTRYTGRTVGAISANGYAACAWQDGDDGAWVSTIRAQNINFDGTLGNPAAPTYTVGGTVSGLAGASLVLQDNGGDDLAIGADGSFTFPTALADGSRYAVSMLTQPTSPTQVCTVANGSGTIAGANVTDVTVACAGDDTIFANGFEQP